MNGTDQDQNLNRKGKSKENESQGPTNNSGWIQGMEEAAKKESPAKAKMILRSLERFKELYPELKEDK